MFTFFFFVSYYDKCTNYESNSTRWEIFSSPQSSFKHRGCPEIIFLRHIWNEVRVEPMIVIQLGSQLISVKLSERFEASATILRITPEDGKCFSSRNVMFNCRQSQYSVPCCCVYLCICVICKRKVDFRKGPLKYYLK